MLTAAMKLKDTCSLKEKLSGLLSRLPRGVRPRLEGKQRLRYADGTTFIAESEEELKSLLMKVKEESEKVGL